MVVNLAVHRKGTAPACIEEWLRAVLHVNDREPLVREYCAPGCVYSAPVRPAMSDRLSHLQRTVAHQFNWFLEIEHPDKAAQSHHLIVAPIVTAASLTRIPSFLAEGLCRMNSELARMVGVF